ncbi:MAG: hypothetical protein VX438_14305 [Planctomycetota bacterium]|nr:hypothetical protein [Planctomycetota bacterium]
MSFYPCRFLNMATLELKTFFDVLEKNDLVTGERLLDLKKALKKETLLASDLEKLVSGNDLTQWQAQRLLNGKHNFLVGDYRLVDFLGKDEFGEVYLVDSQGKTSRNRLRLLSKEISADEKRLSIYLGRVKAFQAFNEPRMPKVIEIKEVGSRKIIVTECPTGQPLVEKLAGKRQNAKLVEKLVEKLARTVAGLESQGLTHGMINGHCIQLTDNQRVVLDLPGEIGFCKGPKNKSKTDVGSLGWLACGLLSGDLDKPQIAGNSMADKFFELASLPEPKIQDLRSVLGLRSGKVSAATSAVSPEISVPKQKSSTDPSFPIEIVTGEEPQSGASPLEPAEVDHVQVPEVKTGGLEPIEKPDGLFGDFDGIEVVSEIQSAHRFPKMVDTSAVTIKPVEKQGNKGKNSKSQDGDPDASNPEASGSKGGRKFLIASLCVVVGLIVGASIYFLTGESGSDPKQLASEIKDAKHRELMDKVANENKPQTASGQETALKPKELVEERMQEIEGSKKLGSEKEPSDHQEKPPKGDLGKANPPDFPKSDPLENPNQEPKKEVLIPNESQQKVPGKPKDGKPKDGKPKDGKPKDGKPKDGKPKKTEDQAINLFEKKEGKNSKNSGGGATAKFANPFSKTPQFIALPTLKKGENDLGFQKLFSLAVPGNFPLSVTLHGGERATKAKMVFTLRASTSIDGTWHVNMVAKDSSKHVANFTFDGGDFGFTWQKEAGSLVNSIYLSNCAIEIKAAQYRHVIALREPVVSSRLNFSKSLNTTAEAKLDYLPNLESVRVVLIEIPKSLAKFEFPKNKPFLSGRADKSALQFKQDNVEHVRGVLTSKLRGSKFSISMETFYITPDKRPQKLTTFQKFEELAGSFDGKIQQAQANFKRLKDEYNKLPSPQAKANFTKVYGLKEIEEQIKLAPQFRMHLGKARAILKSIHQAKLGIRIYYQAGEVEVDLATPDGKQYSPPKPPKPADKQPGPAKKKAKKN